MDVPEKTRIMLAFKSSNLVDLPKPPMTGRRRSSRFPAVVCMNGVEVRPETFSDRQQLSRVQKLAFHAAEHLYFPAAEQRLSIFVGWPSATHSLSVKDG